MRDLNKAIEHVESKLMRGLDRPAAPPREKRQPSSQFWRAPVTDTQYPEQFKPKGKTGMSPITLTTRALKVTIVLDPGAVATLPTPDGQVRSKLTITCDGKVYSADVATKSLRKCKTTIAASEFAASECVVILQGKLKGDEISECGIAAQVKAKPEMEAI
jgi:hypothetical protein